MSPIRTNATSVYRPHRRLLTRLALVTVSCLCQVALPLPNLRAEEQSGQSAAGHWQLDASRRTAQKSTGSAKPLNADKSPQPAALPLEENATTEVPLFELTRTSREQGKARGGSPASQGGVIQQVAAKQSADDARTLVSTGVASVQSEAVQHPQTAEPQMVLPIIVQEPSSTSLAQNAEAPRLGEIADGTIQYVYTEDDLESVPAPPEEEPMPVLSQAQSESVSTQVTNDVVAPPAYDSMPTPAAGSMSQMDAMPQPMESMPLPAENFMMMDAVAGDCLTGAPGQCMTGPGHPVCHASICQTPGVQCPGCRECGKCLKWRDAGWIPWEVYGHGEYIGPARLPHVPEYRLRVDDLIEFVYRLTRVKSNSSYRIEVADELKIESLTAPNLDREVVVQPDGNITVRQLGQMPAAGLTIDELRASLEDGYKSLIADPSISVTPLKMNTMLDELRNTVDARAGTGGQGRTAIVTPEGTIRLPAIGTVTAQGLTLDELQREIEARYSRLVEGLEVTPILVERAPRYVYVTGEVGNPGRFVLTGPTTISQALAMAGSWNVGANLHHIVVFRRDDNWQLMATRLDLHSTVFNPQPCPEGEIWIRDNDIIIVPKHPILVMDDLIELIFTRGVYGVVPVIFGINFAKLGTI